MKKVLLASTILAFSAGVAAAEMSLSGSANMGVKYTDDPAAADELRVHYEVDFTISGSGETDGGLSFGASLELDDTQSARSINDSEVFVSGAFGTLTVGDIDPATDGFGIADIGFDGIGVDDDAESLKAAASDGQDVHYAYSFGDFGFILSADSTDTDDMAVAVTYAGSSFDVGLGWATFAGEDTISVDAGATFGDFSVNAIFSDWTGGASAYGVDVSYALGATTITAAFGDTDIAGDDEDFGIGASYDLGGGAKLAGGVGQVDGNTVADFGITMSF